MHVTVVVPEGGREQLPEPFPHPHLHTHTHTSSKEDKEEGRMNFLKFMKKMPKYF